MWEVATTSIYCPTQIPIMLFRTQATEVTKLFGENVLNFFKFETLFGAFCNLMAQTKVIMINPKYMHI